MQVLGSQELVSPRRWGASHVRILRRRLHLRQDGVCHGYKKELAGSKAIDFMHFHEGFLGNQHEIRKSQHQQ
jgi:hypothetical protein